MKAALSYYGGKQKLAPVIVPMIPKDHLLYNEPYCGGAAILFSKEPSQMEVLNDTNRELMNFYKVVKQDYISLEKKIQITLHSRKQYDHAIVIYNNPELFNDLDRAWAVWVVASQSFSSKFDGGWGYDKTRNTMTKKVANKGQQFGVDYAIRLQNVQLECADAIYVIKSRDAQSTFHYIDPPYFNSDCGHYKGFTEHDMRLLLETLEGIEGRFLLSSYPSTLLAEFAARNGWETKEIVQKVSIHRGSGRGKMKTEVLTANYKI